MLQANEADSTRRHAIICADCCTIVLRAAQAGFSAQIGKKALKMDKKLLEILVCPVTKGKLIYTAGSTELISKQARLAFPIRDGIPILLENEARVLSDEEIAALEKAAA